MERGNSQFEIFPIRNSQFEIFPIRNFPNSKFFYNRKISKRKFNE